MLHMDTVPKPISNVCIHVDGLVKKRRKSYVSCAITHRYMSGPTPNIAHTLHVSGTMVGEDKGGGGGGGLCRGPGSQLGWRG